MRTSEGTELICTALGEYILLVVQNCTGKPWKWPEDEAAEGAGASA